MYRTVNTYLSDNSNIISGNEEFLNHKDSLDQTIKEIKLKEDIRNKAIKGKTTEKKVTREIVTNKALAIAGALYNFAKKKGDQQMMASTKFTKTRFTQLRDVELSIELNSISEKAVEISTEILKFGISQDKLDWDGHVSDLKKWESGPAGEYGVRSIPQTFLVGRDGKIVAINPRTDLEEQIKKFL